MTRWLVHGCNWLLLIAVCTACESLGSRPRDAAGTAAPLPATTKGYELYAWDEGGELTFTLITGTNRLKTVAEVVAPDASVQDGEWIVIHGRGTSALEQTLKRVPAGTSVVLSSLAGLPSLSDASRATVTRILGGRG